MTQSEPWPRVQDWIETHFRGRVTHHERQARWRPAFYVDVECDGQSLPLYFRGARPEIAASKAALEHEMRVMQLLEKNDIPVPHIHGFCEDPPGIVMERSPGRADLSTAENAEEGEAVLNEYMEILARMHSLDTAEFAASGMRCPSTARELGLCDLANWEDGYRKSKQRPEPCLEFVLGWLKRNVPEGRERVSILAADAGQFVFEKGHITALLDFELACLGDPAADLAGMRGRDLSEPLGDLPKAFARYFELTGEEIPKSVIDYHTVRFNLNTPLATAALVAKPPPGVDLIQYMAWYWVWQRASLEVIADGMGLELESVALPEARVTRHSRAHDALAARLKKAGEGEGFLAYESDAAYRVAEYLRRAERYGDELEDQDLDEVAALLGATGTNWREGDAALEEFVAGAGPERDAELVSLFHRRATRHELLLEPVLREVAGARTQMLG